MWRKGAAEMGLGRLDWDRAVRSAYHKHLAWRPARQWPTTIWGETAADQWGRGGQMAHLEPPSLWFPLKTPRLPAMSSGTAQD
jgi:hypothetical protein